MSAFSKFHLAPARFRWFVLVVAAFVAVATICKLDSARQRASATQLALRWARQIATQAETLSLSASERAEADPLAWAARILSQGTNSRIIFAQKFRTEDSVSGQSVENYSFDPDAGVLDYTKVLFPEDLTGIRIKLYVARIGIFGAKSLFAQDLTEMLLFAFFLTLFFFVTKRPEIAVITPPPFITNEVGVPAADVTPIVTAQETPAPEKTSSEWIAGFKQALVELGKEIRDMTRSAQKLSSSAVEAKKEIAAVRAMLEGSVTTSFDPNEMTNLAREAQALFTTADAETKTLLRKLLKVSLDKASESDRLRKKMTEISLVSESAFNALKDISDHTREMSEGITKTTSCVMAVKRSAP
jgi:hypothetical protein